MSYPLASTTWEDEEIDAAIEVLKSKNTTMGEKVSQFENNFAKKFGAKFAVMSNSGSSANLLAVAAISEKYKIKRGAVVLVPAISWSTTYFPFHQYGFKLRFADVDIDTLNYDISHVERILKNEKVDLICAVNLLGNPNEFDKLKRLAGDIPIFEDNCESMGASYKDKQAGTIGIAGSFSTFFSHHICTMEGGVTVTDDEHLHHLMLSIRSHGWTRNLPSKNFVSGIKSDNEFEESFKFVIPGYNLRPLEIEAAIGIKQLHKIDRFLEFRRLNAKKMRSTIFEKYNNCVRFQKEIGNSSWFGFSMIFENLETRNKAVKIFEKKKINCRPVVSGNFCRQPVIQMLDSKFDKLDSADIVHERGLFVGNHHFSIDEQIILLDQALQEIVS